MVETTAPIPEWVESAAKEIRGLDLLGLRQPAQSLGLVVLSGIATVTPTVRYFSIRCWIIKEFGRTGLPASPEAIVSFASKIEAAIVLGNLLANPDRGGFVGSDQARDRIDEGDDPLSLERLVKSQIAFNIYAGSSDGLGLTKTTDSGLPALISERGLPLAEAIEQCVASTEFGKLLATGELPNKLPRHVLRELGDRLPIDSIPLTERELLIAALMPEKPQVRGGSDEAMRVATYCALLELGKSLKRPPRDADLFALAVEASPQASATLQGALDGWACYVIRDMLAVVHEAAMHTVIQELEILNKRESYVDAGALISELVSRSEPVNAVLRGLGLLSQTESYEQLRFGALAQRIEDATSEKSCRLGLRRWLNEMTEEQIVQAARNGSTATVGLLPVAWLLARRRIDFAAEQCSQVMAYLSRQGTGRFGLSQVIIPAIDRWLKSNSMLIDVVAELTHLTVEQHLRVAWSRLATDVKKDVALLIADGDRWYYRKSFANGRLASRLRQTIGWLRQLGLIDDDGLTPSGSMVLQRGQQILDSATGALT
jgi:hypothetical protein